jgi:hypothetical protein
MRKSQLTVGSYPVLRRTDIQLLIGEGVVIRTMISPHNDTLVDSKPCCQAALTFKVSSVSRSASPCTQYCKIIEEFDSIALKLLTRKWSRDW